jgi:hypothetical protein
MELSISKLKEILNRKAGGLGLALIVIVAYIGIKYSITRLNPNFIWYSCWFTIIVLNALAVDLFSNKGDIWIYNSLRDIEQKQNINSEEKLNLIKYHLDQAVKRYMSVFLLVNGFETKWIRIKKEIKKILTGVITIKELLIIVAYALYDLFFRSGLIDIVAPWDVLVLFSVLTMIKIVDASKGFPSLVAEMYREAKKEGNYEQRLEVIGSYIKQLGALFNINYDKEAITKLKQVESLTNETTKTTETKET